MLAAVTGRLLRLAVILGLVSVAAFLLLELAPGDAVSTLIPEGASPEQVNEIREAYGLNDPLMVRYLDWAQHAVRGDLGRSIGTQQPVSEAIGERLLVNIELAALSITLALLVAIPVGLYTGYRPGRFLDRLTTALASITLSVPNFLMGVLLVYLLAVQTSILPPTGWVSFSRDPMGHISHVILPVLTLALAEIVLFIRLLRGDVVATLQQDFVLAARARGLPTRVILFGHALRPSSFSLVTAMGVTLGRLLGGTVIVESIFSLPGLGSLVLTSISTRDFLVIQGVVLVIAVSYVCINAVIDLSYPLLDPRVRKG